MYIRSADDETETVILWLETSCVQKTKVWRRQPRWVWLREEEGEADLACAGWMGSSLHPSSLSQSFGKQCRIGMFGEIWSRVSPKLATTWRNWITRWAKEAKERMNRKRGEKFGRKCSNLQASGLIGVENVMSGYGVAPLAFKPCSEECNLTPSWRQMSGKSAGFWEFNQEGLLEKHMNPAISGNSHLTERQRHTEMQIQQMLVWHKDSWSPFQLRGTRSVCTYTNVFQHSWSTEPLTA